MTFHLITIIGISLIFASCGEKYQLVEERNVSGYYLKSYYLDEDSLRQGKYTSYYDKDQIFEQSNYRNDLLDGKRFIYFENGQIEIEENYIGGILHDSFFVYHSNGNLELKGHYVNGSLEGQVMKYYSSGFIEEEVTYENNTENGPFTEYYENGMKKWEGTYLNGDNEFGELLKYSEEGILVRKLMCDSLAVCRTTWTQE